MIEILGCGIYAFGGFDDNVISFGNFIGLLWMLQMYIR